MVESQLPRWRHLLDGAASLAVVLLCVVGTWKLLAPGDSPGAGRTRAAGSDSTRAVRPAAQQPPLLPADPVPLDGAKLRGNASAPIAVIEYSDFQCPYCAAFARDVKPQLIREYVETGRVLLAFRHLPLTAIHPVAQMAAEASECANERNRFWELHDLFFRDRQSLTAQMIREHSVASGVEIELEECTRRHSAKVLADVRSAKALGVSGTPTFLIGTLDSNRQVKVVARLSGAAPLDRFRQEIDQLLAVRAVP